MDPSRCGRASPPATSAPRPRGWNLPYKGIYILPRQHRAVGRSQRIQSADQVLQITVASDPPAAVQVLDAVRRPQRMLERDESTPVGNKTFLPRHERRLERRETTTDMSPSG